MRRHNYWQSIQRAALSIAVCAAASLSTAVVADVLPADRLAALIAQLDAPTLDAREQATQTLIKAETSFETVAQAGIDVSALTAEQRSRLDRVWFERFKRTPRAGLGVAFDAQFQGGVRLASVEANFPAAAFLQPLDRILSAEGASFAPFVTQQAWQAFRHRILSFDPGDTIPVSILRRNNQIKMSVPLGAYSDLGRAPPLSDQDYASAWEFRRSRIGFALRDEGRIAASMSGKNWPVMTPLDRVRRSPEMGLLAGGSPGTRPVIRLEEIAKIVRAQINATSNTTIREANPRRAAGPGKIMDPRKDRTVVLQQIDQWEQIRSEARARAEDQSLDASERTRWAQQVVNAEEQLALMRQRLALIPDNR